MNAPAAPLVARLRAEIADLKDQLAAEKERTELAVALALREEAELIAGNELLSGSIGPLFNAGWNAANKSGSATILAKLPAAALAKLVELERDAERYRWLRDGTDAVCLTFSRGAAETDCYSGSELDATIDAARGTK